MGDTLRVPISIIPAGEYRLDLDPSKVKDIAGNLAKAKDVFRSLFSVSSSGISGEHVEFTPFAPPKKQEIPKEGFNPGDNVETRVARLFYYRDAARVAQIINRNVKSYNQAAVTIAERTAENSRDSADGATDERRERERAAVRAAERAREAEQKLADAQQKLAGAQALQAEIAIDKDEQTKLNAIEDSLRTDLQNQRLKDLTDRIKLEEDELKRSFGGTEGTKTLVASVAGLQQSVATSREGELAKRDEWNSSQARESRARAKQFRDEVTAAETDPDTYVAGKMHSVDPVTQCSLSVIGEGLIQIRGPIKGINTIRTMINQIDSPVGQIKIGIFSVQVNGEEGEKMEKVVGDTESSIDLSRFLVNHSLELLRKAIQAEAAEIAANCEHVGHYQVDRDRRYLYTFFGRDFIDELYAMDSEFLRTENKVLSLHSMDTVSLNRALFILALAKNDVRERIVARFLASAKTDLADAEFDFRRSSELKPHRTQKRFPPWNLTHLPLKNHYHKEQLICEAVHRNALQRYHFRNFSGFFDVGIGHADTMNPMQREFIRLAQIFKARLIAEMEWKQRVLERGLIEDRSNDENLKSELMREVHLKALTKSRDAYFKLLDSDQNLQAAEAASQKAVSAVRVIQAQWTEVSEVIDRYVDLDETDTALVKLTGLELVNKLLPVINELEKWNTSKPQEEGDKTLAEWKTLLENLRDELGKSNFVVANLTGDLRIANISNASNQISDVAENSATYWANVHKLVEAFKISIACRPQNADFCKAVEDNDATSYITLYKALRDKLNATANLSVSRDILEDVNEAYKAQQSVTDAELSITRADELIKRTRGALDHRKLLNHMIDQKEEKFIELVEGTRSHISVIDQYLKRLSIALEDDFKVQFYDPAFVRVREAARGTSVNLSQVERTTILTNNRAFAKVDPQATMEFDLPKRQIAIKEAFDAAKALVEDSGALMKDPTFLSAFQMMGGAKQPTTVKNVVPTQSMGTNQQHMGMAPPPQGGGEPGSALQSLVPEPAIYKIETGTGFQIRPVMQPDGDSAVYDFDYMYTTNIREPVRADEKHVGRIKRHFVHTACTDRQL